MRIASVMWPFFVTTFINMGISLAAKCVSYLDLRDTTSNHLLVDTSLSLDSKATVQSIWGKKSVAMDILTISSSQKVRNALLSRYGRVRDLSTIQLINPKKNQNRRVRTFVLGPSTWWPRRAILITVTNGQITKMVERHDLDPSEPIRFKDISNENIRNDISEKEVIEYKRTQANIFRILTSSLVADKVKSLGDTDIVDIFDTAVDTPDQIRYIVNKQPDISKDRYVYVEMSELDHQFINVYTKSGNP